MAVRNLVVRGRVGFVADDVEYIPTHGLDVGAAIVDDQEPRRTTRRDPSQVTRTRSEHANTPNLPTRKPTVER